MHVAGEPLPLALERGEQEGLQVEVDEAVALALGAASVELEVEDGRLPLERGEQRGGIGVGMAADEAADSEGAPGVGRFEAGDGLLVRQLGRRNTRPSARR
ncbi:hypothetical protein OV079_02820 [Nannocystis pusilla]|uniref:Uncharacterized protein n=1 Tax=Nannocystis pusilla TaxID=889268 RepID=A0A9X3EI58_9BACT|nr:hypothetical protein [Nannocystis pusilla]MCY1004517.1 hypothetical protein [Nannocystis pusilla]